VVYKVPTYGPDWLFHFAGRIRAAIVDENEDCGVSKPVPIAYAKAAFETAFANGSKINLEHHLV
jgi:hypothetical protein